MDILGEMRARRRKAFLKNVFFPRILFQVPMDGDFAFITGDVKRNIPPFQCVADFPGGKPVRVVRSGAGDGQLWSEAGR